MMKRTVIAILLICIAFTIHIPSAAAAPYRPTVLVSKFSTDPAPVVPGQNFVLHMELKNVGDRDARKITVVVNSGKTSVTSNTAESSNSEEQYVFSPVSSGNVLYINKIGRGKAVEASIAMIAPGDIKPGVYDLTLSIDYGESGSKTYKTTQHVGVVVAQEDTLKIVSVKYPKEMKAGESAELSAEIVNLGNAPLRGIYLEVTGDVRGEENSLYFGTFEAGDSDEYSTQFTVEKPGTLNGEMIVRYYDQFNQQREARQRISIQVNGEEAAVKNKEEKKTGFLQSVIGFFKTLLGLGGNP